MWGVTATMDSTLTAKGSDTSVEPFSLPLNGAERISINRAHSQNNNHRLFDGFGVTIWTDWKSRPLASHSEFKATEVTA